MLRTLSKIKSINLLKFKFQIKQQQQQKTNSSSRSEGGVKRTQARKKKKEGKIKAEYKERWFEAYFSPSVKQGEITKSAK